MPFACKNAVNVLSTVCKLHATSSRQVWLIDHPTTLVFRLHLPGSAGVGMSNYPPTPLTGGTEPVRASLWFALEIHSTGAGSSLSLGGAQRKYPTQAFLSFAKATRSNIDLTRHDHSYKKRRRQGHKRLDRVSPAGEKASVRQNFLRGGPAGVLILRRVRSALRTRRASGPVE
jgi:hypothetical protein